MAGAGHRSTLKQKNKSHNHGKHRSKRNLKRELHGKTNVKALTKNKKIKDVLRQEASQTQSGNREDVLDQRRSTNSLPPRLVAVVSLERSVDVPVIVDLLKEAELSADVRTSEQNVVHVSAGKMKKRLSFIVPEYGNLQAVLDAARVADVVLFLLSAERGMDRLGEHCLACITGQGMAAHVFACQGLSNLSKKKTTDARKRIDKLVQKSFPGDKFRSLDTWQDAQVSWRQMANMGEKSVHFRDSRPYLLAEKVEFAANTKVENESPEEDHHQKGTLKLSGYLRGGSNLHVDQLVHLPGWGDFQLSQLDQWTDPYPLVLRGNKDRRGGGEKGAGGDAEMKEVNETALCLAKAVNPDSLQSETIPDEMDQEQTWPTPDELKEAEKVKVKSLIGVSDYQSNWILDSEDDEDESGDDDDDMVDEEMQDGEKGDDEDDDEEEEDDEDTNTETNTEPGTDNYDEQMDMDDEKKMYERMKEERLHVHFPDEVDTPLDTTARTRFARYRGMDSFQTTVWDPNESLPFDYARIYRVSKHHYKRLRKLSMQEREESGDNLPAELGNFITVHVKNVPQDFMDSHTPGQPVTLFGLFPNEQKMTLVSALIQRMPSFKTPVKSKDALVFQVGFRRFSAAPIFSEHSFQTKFKMERFLPGNGFIVASMFAPIMFAPAPVLVFRENVMERFDLVAKGSLLPLDTNRIVIKRVVLSGAPFKINKRSVVVRYMFFNREDIEFYKPIELRTKWGKRGHIKQALGTHGHMKCKFSGQLKSEDTILMNLYKRVFPKWSFNARVPILPPAILEEEEEEEIKQEENTVMEEVKEEERGEAYKMFD